MFPSLIMTYRITDPHHIHRLEIHFIYCVLILNIIIQCGFVLYLILTKSWNFLFSEQKLIDYISSSFYGGFLFFLCSSAIYHFYGPRVTQVVRLSRVHLLWLDRWLSQDLKIVCYASVLWANLCVARRCSFISNVLCSWTILVYFLLLHFCKTYCSMHVEILCRLTAKWTYIAASITATAIPTYELRLVRRVVDEGINVWFNKWPFNRQTALGSALRNFVVIHVRFCYCALDAKRKLISRRAACLLIVLSPKQNVESEHVLTQCQPQADAT